MHAQAEPAWETLIAEFARSLEKACGLARKSPETKPLAHKWSNWCDGGDAGLTYLREARHVLEHGLIEIEVLPSMTVLGGAILVSEGIGVTISNLPNFLDHSRDHVDEAIVSEDGSVSFKGPGKLDVDRLPASVALTTIVSESKRKTFEPPDSVLGKAVVKGDAVALAEAAVTFLEECLDQLRKSFANP
jgi:hypothetical protein